MAAPANVEEFLDLVKKSGVSDEKRLDPHLNRLRQAGGIPPDAGKMAGILVRDGFLTQFQAEQILQGKWRRFTIGKYKVLERLGSGGMGAVYLCEHKLMRRRVAVKVLPTAKAADPSALERFYREARAVAALDHPNIVHAYDIDQDESLHFLVMEYVDGSSLQDIVKKAGPMNVLRACHYVAQAAQGLEHASQASLVHRDIKPGNILVDRSGVVKVLDMGLARFFNDEDDILTKKYDENVLGTADYLAPEQALDSHGVDIRADIYSLGATFYFMLTAKTPFGEGTVAQKLIWHQTRHPKPIQEIRPDVAPGVVAVVNRMMAKDPAQRYQTPGEVAQALAPFIVTPIAPPPENEMPHLSPAAVGAVPVDSTPETMVRTATPSPVRPGMPPASTPPASAPRGTAPLRAGPPMAQPLPTAAVAAAPPGEEVRWEDLDTHVPTARDTTPDSKRGRRNLTQEVFTHQKRRVWLVVLLFGVPFVLIVGVLAVIFLANQGPPPQKPEDEKEEKKRDRLIVRKGAARSFGTFPTLKAALEEARRGETIEIQDDVLTECVLVDGDRIAAKLTITAPAGKTVVWKSDSKDPTQPILRISHAAGFTLSGRGITFDGSLPGGAKVRDLVSVQLKCDGLIMENARFEEYGRSAIYFVNAQGAEKDAIHVKDIVVHGPGTDPAGGAIVLDADDAVSSVRYNDYMVFDGGQFLGLPPGKILVPLRSEVAGKHIIPPK
ncbi:MAG: protein kinase [Gemmataceae bacterium]